VISVREDQAEKESNAATPRKLVMHKKMVCRGVLNVAAKAATNQIVADEPHTSPPSDFNQTGAKRLQSHSVHGCAGISPADFRRLQNGSIFKEQLQEAGNISFLAPVSLEANKYSKYDVICLSIKV
jgi:hypothetical protein